MFRSHSDSPIKRDESKRFKLTFERNINEMKVLSLEDKGKEIDYFSYSKNDWETFFNREINNIDFNRIWCLCNPNCHCKSNKPFILLNIKPDEKDIKETKIV